MRKNLQPVVLSGLALVILCSCSSKNFTPSTISPSDNSQSAPPTPPTPPNPPAPPAALKAVSIILAANVAEALPITATSLLSVNSAPSGQKLSLVSLGKPSLGAISGENGSYSFLANSMGTSQLSYTISDTEGTKATGNITIQVLSKASVTGAFYASNLSGQIFVLDPSTGSLKNSLNSTYKGSSVGFNDLAITDAGIMYGKDESNNIYTVDASSGIASLVISDITSGNRALGLTVLPDGRLVTARESSNGYSVVAYDPKTKMTNTLVPESANYAMSGGDIKYLPDGFLYWTVTDSSSKLCRHYSGQGNQAIVKINPGTGARSEIVCLNDSDVFGLGYASKALYGFSGGGDLIQVNLSTGAIKLINATGDVFVGAASNPALW